MQMQNEEETVNGLGRLSFFTLVAFLLTASACSYEAPPPEVTYDRTDPHKVRRCFYSSECFPGERCDTGFCKDIYFPRNRIKNY